VTSSPSTQAPIDTLMPGKYGPESVLETQRSYIDGGYVSNASGDSFAIYYPGDNHKICDVEIAGPPEIETAVKAAKKGFEIWRKTPAAERSKILRRAAHILLERNAELAELETLDTGKAIAETAEIDIIAGVEVLDYYAGVAPTLHGEHIDLPPSAFATVRREPIGVCVGIGAWNYPIQIALWKSAAALACGNSFIFKPAEQTPLSALKLAEIYTEAGLPDGVFNVLQGAGETGAALIEHPGVSKVSLTGSVPTGKKVMAACAAQLKKVTLELGGKSPIIVFDDADFESALNAALFANFYSSGQVCSNGTRVFVQEGLYKSFVDALKARTEDIVVGDPFNPTTQLGPLVSKVHFDKVASYMQAAKKSGARHICGGETYESGLLSKGNYISPAVFADCEDGMDFVTDEIFGPLMAVLPFKSEAEALERANATEFGLAGAVFTTDFARAHRVAQDIQAGTVWINDYNALPASVPFGGYKQSGMGRENGSAGIEPYTQLKMIYANLGEVEALY